MAGHSQHPRVIADNGRVQVSAANTGQTMIDARPSPPTPDSMAKLRTRAGALYGDLAARAAVWGDDFRAELNARAGGQAPPSVMAEASMAEDMMTLAKAAHILAGAQLGKISEAEVDAEVQHYVERFQTSARTAAGLFVVTKDLLNNARQQASAYAGTALIPKNDNGQSDLLRTLNIEPTPIDPEEGEDLV